MKGSNRPSGAPRDAKRLGIVALCALVGVLAVTGCSLAPRHETPPLPVASAHNRDFQTVVLRVAEAQRDLLTAEQQWVQARRALISSQVRLYAALGGGGQDIAASPASPVRPNP